MFLPAQSESYLCLTQGGLPESHLPWSQALRRASCDGPPHWTGSVSVSVSALADSGPRAVVNVLSGSIKGFRPKKDVPREAPGLALFLELPSALLPGKLPRCPINFTSSLTTPQGHRTSHRARQAPSDKKYPSSDEKHPSSDIRQDHPETTTQAFPQAAHFHGVARREKWTSGSTSSLQL